MADRLDEARVRRCRYDGVLAGSCRYGAPAQLVVRKGLGIGSVNMRSRKKTFEEMSDESGIKGIVTPLHPGAERFRKEEGEL